MKKSIVIGILCVVFLAFIITGCGEDQNEYTHIYDVLLNGEKVTEQFFAKDGHTMDYTVKVDKETKKTDLTLTFDVYETPIRKSKFESAEYLKSSFGVSTLKNDFKTSPATTKEVEINKVKYNKYSVTYTFNDIDYEDEITIKLGENVVKELQLIDDSFKIHFII
jgi:hypothetical protein